MSIGARGSRLGRLIDRYGLLGMAGDLESQWTSTHADADPWDALEELTTYFNTAIVQSVCARIEGDPPAPAGSPEAVYRTLAAEDASSGDDAEDVRGWFEAHGVDPDALTREFVSPRTMYRYLDQEVGIDMPVRLEHPPEVARRRDVTVEDLDDRIARIEDQQEARRLRFIRELYEGTNVPDAAEAIGCDPSTGYRWLADWEAGGVEELLTDGTPGWFKLDAREERAFVAHLVTADRWSTGEVLTLVEEEFDVTYSERHLRRKLEEYGMEKVPQTDAYRWPDGAPEDPAGRRAQALEERRPGAPDAEDGRDWAV